MKRLRSAPELNRRPYDERRIRCDRDRGRSGRPVSCRTAHDLRDEVALIERNLFGGTCVTPAACPRRRCRSAYAAHLSRRSAEYGIFIEQAIEIDMKRVKARAGCRVNECSHECGEVASGHEALTVLEGHARFKDPIRSTGGRNLLKAPAHLHQRRRYARTCPGSPGRCGRLSD